MSLPFPCPAVGERIDWSQLDEPWIAPMATCMQDRLHHAEGDVWTHTQMVCDALIQQERWRALPAPQRWITFVACLLHDIEKPATRRVEEGRIRHPRHSARGARRARQLLYRAGVPARLREQVANIILWHQVPFFLITQARPEDQAAKLSLTTQCDLLGLVNIADALGRICEDQQSLVDNAELFLALCQEEGCLQVPFQFPSEHARYRFAQGISSSRFDAPPSRPTCEVTLMSGLPGAGKDHYLRAHYAGPVISLDALRRQLKAPATGHQGRVLAAAEEQARVHLRTASSFAWNATNLTRDTRRRLVKLCTDYGAHVHIVYVEADYARWQTQNHEREDAIPKAAMHKMLAALQVPDCTEAHRVTWVLGDHAAPAGYAPTQKVSADHGHLG